MSAFAALMALSASQTKEAQSAVQTALAQRQRNEELKRKKQEEIDRKAREEEAKLRQRWLEDQKKEQELEAKRESERLRLEAEQSRREEEARNALLYGPKKAKQQVPRWPTSQSGIKEEVRRRRVAEGHDDDSGSPAMALTREEKRQRRMEMELRRTYQSKRASSVGGYGKSGRRLPGGAIDAPSTPASDAGASAQSVKARLAALPNTLTKLNVNKRDTRTIDEILQDRAKVKHVTLDGDDAREFNDWFGRSKRKEAASVPSTQSSTSLPSASSSGANSPGPVGSKPAPQPLAKPQHPVANGKTASSTPGAKSSLHSRPALSARSSSLTLLKSSSVARSAQSRSPAPKMLPAKSGSASGSVPPRSGGAPSRKRPRSPSPSLSPLPKRRMSEVENTFSSEIWKMFGKDRSSYVTQDVFSDDEDMEVDASFVMQEEMRSARLAKREDELALEEEKRHEEDKRRRKREREMRERQGT